MGSNYRHNLPIVTEIGSILYFKNIEVNSDYPVLIFKFRDNRKCIQGATYHAKGLYALYNISDLARIEIQSQKRALNDNEEILMRLFK